MGDREEIPVPATGQRHLVLEPLGTLRHRDFRLLWMGTLALSSTNVFQFFAIGLLIQEHFPRVLGPSFPVLLILGVVGFIRGAGMVIFTLLGGVLADRYDRRNLALITQGVSVILIGLFSLLLALGSIQLWQVLLLVFATSAGTSFGLPARQALLPQLVERREVPSAVALFTAAVQSSITYSSFLAGWSLGTLGIAATFALSGVGNAILFLALMFMRHRGAGAADSRQPGMLLQVREGFRYGRRNHTVLGILIVVFTLSAVGLSTVANLTPNWMFSVMDVSPTTWGLLATMWGVGSLVAAYGILAYLRQSRLSGRVFLGASLFFSVMLIVWGLNRSVLGLGVVQFTMGGSYSVVLIIGAAIIQTQVPDEIRGRVMSVFNLGQALSMINGITVGGFAQGVGITTAWPLLGIVLTVAVIAGAIALPRLRQGTTTGPP